MKRRIFLSHAGKDKKLVDSFVDLLQTGMDVKSADVFCTSLEGLGIPSGLNFVEYIRKQLKHSDVVIALLSPNYFSSQFCICELGATWALSGGFEPLLVPPCSFSNLQGILTGVQVTDIQDSKRLTEFQERLSPILGLKVNHARWEQKRDSFLKELPEIISDIYGTAGHEPWSFATKLQAHKITGSKREIALQKYELEREFYNRCSKCSDTIIRCRGGSSIFSIPYTVDDMRVGKDMRMASFEEVEGERKKLYMKLMERGYQFRYIIELNAKEWLRKGYSNDDCRRKLLSLKSFFERYKYHPNFGVALKSHGDAQMYIIFGHYFIVESTKENLADRRAYDACRIHNDQNYVDGSILRFDDEYASLLTANTTTWKLRDPDDYRSRNLRLLETIDRQLSSLPQRRA